MLVTAIGIGGQALIVGHYAAFQAQRNWKQRVLWRLLAIAMLFWAGAYAAIFVLKDIIDADSTHALLDSALFMARGAPFLLMLTSGIDDDGDRHVWRLDITQAAVHILAVSLLILGNPLTGTGPLGGPDAYSIRDVQTVALAALAAGVALLHRDRRDAGLFGPLAAMLAVYLIACAIVNNIFIETWGVSSGSPLLAFGALPMVAFFLARAFPRAALPHDLGRLTGTVGLIAPAVIPATTLLVVLSERLRGDPFGPALGMLALLLYGWRMVTIQLHHRRSIAELVAAHSHAAGLSLTDPLTALGNRRSFEMALSDAVARGDDQPVTVLMIDTDWFKSFNDSLGHGAGDVALRRVADALAAITPPDSAVARVGGEEFAVLVRVDDPDAAGRLGERVRSAVAALNITHPRSPLGYLTVSVGVATRATTDCVALMAAADAALYIAKNAGRDQVCLAESAAFAV